MFNRLSWLLLIKLGVQFKLALLLLMLLFLTIFCYVTYTLPTQQSMEKWQARVAIQPAPTIVVIDQDPKLDFWKTLPDIEQIDAVIRDISISAYKYQVAIDEINYQDQLRENQAYLQYQITFQGIQDYPHLKLFLSELMNAQPALALQNVELSRESIDVSQLSANFNFILFVKRL